MQIDVYKERGECLKYRGRKLRHEYKYLISPYYYELLRTRLKAVLRPDSNGADGEYQVTSLYFDDIYKTAYNDKLVGVETRRKFRIRAYNLSTDRITLEAKHKDNSYVSKLSTLITLPEYYSILKGDYGFYYDNEEKYIGTSLEALAVSDMLTRPRPSVIVDYHREAYICDAGNVRITFDKKLATSYDTLDMFETTAFSPVIGDNIVLEVKYDDFLPKYIEPLLSGFPFINESVSKFVLCTDKLLEVKKYEFTQHY